MNDDARGLQFVAQAVYEYFDRVFASLDQQRHDVIRLSAEFFRRCLSRPLPGQTTALAHPLVPARESA